MKKFSFLLLILLMELTASAQQYMYIWEGNDYTSVRTADLGTMPFSGEGQNLTIGSKVYALTTVDSITFQAPILDTTGMVVVTYSGTKASVSIPDNLKDAVTAKVSNATVTITNTNEKDELTFVLQGEATTNGSFTLNGTYKYTLILNGVSLTRATSGSAININNGKRGTVILQPGTVNSFTDRTNGTQKYCFYSKGHLEFGGCGTLNITGRAKHGLGTKEYLMFKRSLGNVNILGSVSDGIHCGQYFQMNGGDITMTSVGSDCIQVEALGEGDEMDGQMLFKGGTLNLPVTAVDSKGLKSDSLITISGGTFNIEVSGDGSKGISTDTNMLIDEAYSATKITINATGGPYVDSSVTPASTKNCMGMTIGGDLTINAGTIKVTHTGKDSKGIKVDGTYIHNGGTVEADISNEPAAAQ